MSEWTIWAGLLTGWPIWRSGAWTVRQLAVPPPLFPLSYLFWGWRYRPVPHCRRCAEVQLLCSSAALQAGLVARADCQALRGYHCGVWCGMMSWSKVVMNHTSFILKMHSVAYRHSGHGFGGQVTLHLGSIMPDWHDLGYMLKVEVGEFGGDARDTHATRGSFRYVITRQPASTSPLRSSGRTPYLPITLP